MLNSSLVVEHKNIFLFSAIAIPNSMCAPLPPGNSIITTSASTIPCDSKLAYFIISSLDISSTYIREQLNEKGSTSGSRILNTNDVVEKTLEDAKESYKLKEGVLKGQESKTYELRLWLDESTPAVSEVMNKTLNSK